MLKREIVQGIVISNTCVKLYRNWIINEVARAGEHTNERTYVRTYSHTYVRDRPYIPSTTLLCEGIITDGEKIVLLYTTFTYISSQCLKCLQISILWAETGSLAILFNSITFKIVYGNPLYQLF